MSDSSSHDMLIDRLVADLMPIRRLPTPVLRTLIWLAVILLLAVALASVADVAAVRRRLMGSPDMWMAVVGSTGTAALAALAAFELSMPDRSRLWAVLPLPTLALWIVASGLGCARIWLVPGTHEASSAETQHCMAFIVGLSAPLSLFTILMLRRGCSLSPTLTSIVAGLAVASAAASLLNFFHPYDAAFDDLVVHAAAVLVVIGLNKIVAGRLLAPNTVER